MRFNETVRSQGRKALLPLYLLHSPAQHSQSAGGWSGCRFPPQPVTAFCRLWHVLVSEQRTKKDTLPNSLAFVSPAAPRHQPSRESDCEVASWILTQSLKMVRGALCGCRRCTYKRDGSSHSRAQSIRAWAEWGLHSVCHTLLEQDRNDI